MTQHKILRLDSVKQITGLSTSSIWRQEKSGKFPRRIHISQRAVGWLASEINQWIENQITAGYKNASR